MPCFQWQHGLRPIPFWACHSAVGQGLGGCRDDASSAPLLIVTHRHLLDGSLRSARGLPPFLPAFDTGSPVPRRGKGCLPFTGEVRVDDSPCWEYHLTHMDTQLSKITRPLPLIPRALRHGFERTGRTQLGGADALRAGSRVCLACLSFWLS
jgi:hypothetical protein